MSSPVLLCVLVIAALVIGYVIAFAGQSHKLQQAKDAGRLEAEAALNPKLSMLETRLENTENELEKTHQAHSAVTDELRKTTGDLSDFRAESARETARLEAELKAERENAKKRIEDENAMANRFEMLARRALAENSNSFLDTAKNSFATEQKTAQGDLLAKHTAFLDKLNPIEEHIGKLHQSVERLSEDKERLATEAHTLSTALRKAEVRGRWGEITLQRVAELAGMRQHCDFYLQQTIVNDEQAVRRPDMVVRLPLDRYVVVDSKAVMDAYISACSTTVPEQYAQFLAQHAKNVRSKIDDLSKVDYAKVLERQGKNVADMVVCYIPGEAFFSAAVAQDPLLLEYAAERRVFLASPTTLIVLLRAIALGWRDHELSQNAEQIRQLGRELYTRLSTMKGHFDKLGDSVEKTVNNYNAMVSSLNRKVFPQARRFQSLGAADTGSKSLEDSDSVEAAVNDHESADWAAAPVLSLAAEATDETVDAEETQAVEG